MTFLIKPAFILCSLLIGIYTVFWIEKVKPSDIGFVDVFSKEVLIEKHASYPLRKPSGKLTSKEIEYARIAWKYFQNNYKEETGLVNGVDFYTAATFWDMSSYFLALTSAYEIGIIDSTEFDRRLTKCLHTLSTLELYDEKMPNKLYNTESLAMVDYENKVVERGIGWSAIDIGRFYGALNKIIHGYPQYQQAIKKVVNRWQMHHMIDEGILYGIVFPRFEPKPQKVQEGKLGYEEYISKGLAMAGYDVSESLSYTDFTKFVDIYGIKLAVDKRETEEHAAHNHITSEPYILDGLEFGWDVNSRELAYRVYLAQKERYRQTGILTCVSEDHIDTAPHFVYNTVYTDRGKWNCVTEDGSDATAFKSISTKAAFGWYVLWDDEYSEKLFEAVKDLHDPKRGWYSGKYEKDGKVNTAISINTNAVILEALNYKKSGKLIRF
jgi:hypothetical protein